MPIYISFGTFVGQNYGKGRVYGMKQGMKTLTPRNMIYAIQSPREIVTGQASGTRQYDPITITKELDPASPQFFNPSLTGKEFHEVHINIYRSNFQGMDQPCCRITLTNASLVSYQLRPILRRTPGDPGELEEVQLNYQEITWTSTTGGTCAQDDWSSPSA